MGFVADLRWRAEAVLRRLSGRTRVDELGCRWSARSANALKSIRGMRRANPIMDRLLAEISADDVFLDVGANLGAYSIRAACRQPAPRQVYALEPSTGPYLALLENIDLNACGDRCLPLPVAVGAQDGFVEFKVDSLDPSTGTSHVASDREASHEPTGALWKPSLITTRVPCFTIDRLVESGTIEQPTVVKIDVEGFEGEVMKGMRGAAPGIRLLSVEIHPDRLVGAASPEALIEEITDLGFEEIASGGRGRQKHYLFQATSGPPS